MEDNQEGGRELSGWGRGEGKQDINERIREKSGRGIKDEEEKMKGL